MRIREPLAGAAHLVVCGLVALRLWVILRFWSEPAKRSFREACDVLAVPTRALLTDSGLWRLNGCAPIIAHRQRPIYVRCGLRFVFPCT